MDQVKFMEDSLFKWLSYTNFTWSTLEYLDPDSGISSMELPLECFHKGLTREKPNKVNFLKYISCFTKSWRKKNAQIQYLCKQNFVYQDKFQCRTLRNKKEIWITDINENVKYSRNHCVTVLHCFQKKVNFWNAF